MVSSFIYRHILKLPPNTIITTRELLPYGRRGAVDQTLYRMVKNGFLTRLAYGVFIRDASNCPTTEEIAKAKMKAWGKQLLKYGENLLMDLKVAVKHNRFQATFALNAHSSSFDTLQGRVYLKGIGPRKVRLCATAVGKVVYALWHKRNGSCEGLDVQIATRSFNRKDRDELRRAASFMPAWLNELCYFRYPPAQLC